MRPVSWKMPWPDQRVCSPGFCISELGTESLPFDAAVIAAMILRRQSTSSCQAVCRAVCSFAARFAARLALKFANQLMGKG